MIKEQLFKVYSIIRNFSDDYKRDLESSLYRELANPLFFNKFPELDEPISSLRQELRLGTTPSEGMILNFTILNYLKSGCPDIELELDMSSKNVDDMSESELAALMDDEISRLLGKK